mmetsp:Transcript_52090/g.121125  ORF Transcript_52090/g.121125 Transcript_52090/m.121125 type:complete len:177 (-) Transcript_52090:321-851(-)
MRRAARGGKGTGCGKQLDADRGGLADIEPDSIVQLFQELGAASARRGAARGGEIAGGSKRRDASRCSVAALEASCATVQICQELGKATAILRAACGEEDTDGGELLCAGPRGGAVLKAGGAAGHAAKQLCQESGRGWRAARGGESAGCDKPCAIVLCEAAQECEQQGQVSRDIMAC